MKQTSLKAPPLWLLPLLALLLAGAQLPGPGFWSRQVGLHLLLQAVWAEGALPVGPASPPLSPAQRETLQAAARQLSQSGPQAETERALGRVALAAQRDDEAERYLLARLEQAPGDVMAHFFLGQLYLRQERWLAGIEQWTAAGASQPLLALARNLHRQQHYPEAMAALEAVIKLQPADETAYLLAAELGWQQGERERALALVQQVTAIAPHHPAGYALLGRLLFEGGWYEEAIPYFQQAIQRTPSHTAPLQVMVGRSYAALKRWSEAAAAYGQAIQAAPEERGAYVLGGDAQCQLDRPAEARRFYEQALHLGETSERVRQAVEFIARQGVCAP